MECLPGVGGKTGMKKLQIAFCAPRAWALLAIVLLGAVVYAPSFTADFSSDEIAFIAWTEHATARDYLYRFIPFRGEMIYRPFCIVIWSLYYWIWGANAPLYHIQLVAAHLLNAFLLYLILVRLTGMSAFPLVAALLFAFTPLAVETAAWIMGIDDIYCMMFSLLSILAFLAIDRGGRRYLALSLALGLVSLLTRESAVTLPFVIAMCDLLAAGKRRGETLAGRARRRWRIYGSYFLLASVFFAVRQLLLGGLGGYQASGRTYIPPLGSIFHTALVQLPALHAIPMKSTTIQELFPAGLARLLMTPGLVIAVFILLLALLSTGRKIPWGVAIFGAGWWLVATFAHWQVLNKLNLVSKDMEYSHYLYQGSAGFSIAVGALLFCGERGWRRAAGRALLLLMLAAFITLSRSYCRNYRRAFRIAHEVLRQFSAMDLGLSPGSRVFMMDVPARLDGVPVWWGGTSIAVWRDYRPSLEPMYAKGLWHPAVELQVRERYPYRIYLLNRDVRLEERRNEYEAPPPFSLDYLRALKPGETDFFLRWLPREERLEDITALVRGKASKTPPPRPISWTAGEIARGGQWAPFGDARIEALGRRKAVRLSVGPRGGGLRLEGAPFPSDERASIEMEAALLSPERAKAALEYRTEEEDRYDADKRTAFVIKAAPGFTLMRVPVTRRIYDLIDGKIVGCRIVFPAGHPAELEIRSIRLR